jgi:hypothetical protein
VIITKECSMTSGNMLDDIKLFKTLPPLCDKTNEDITPICGSRNAMN